MEKAKCIVPTCGRELPPWRVRDDRITCSKHCSGIWHNFSRQKREKIRGRKYGT